MVDTGRFLRAFLATAGAVAIGLLLTSCGNSGSDAATASGPLTKADFIKQASAICRKKEPAVQRRLEAAAKSRGGALGSSPKETKAIFKNVVLPLYDELFSEMEELTPPSGDRVQIGRILQAYRAAQKRAEAKLLKLSYSNPFIAADKAATRYGIEECSF